MPLAFLLSSQLLFAAERFRKERRKMKGKETIKCYKPLLTEERMVSMQVVSEYTVETSRLNTTELAAQFVRDVLHLDRQAEEYLYLLCFNARREVIALYELSHGSACWSICPVRELFQKALFANAVSILLVHNHPTGYSEPSVEDRKVTERVVTAGKILGIPLDDHIIIGEDYYSFREHGMI